MLAGKHKQFAGDASKPGAAVVLFHGLFMPGTAMTVLARRLGHAYFSYHARRAVIQHNAAALAAFLKSIAEPAVHFVAHSLGGLVLMQLLRDYPTQRAGRVVLLGTPYRGSHVARRIACYRWGRWLCGSSLQAALPGDGPLWPGGRELGVIAGTAPVGMGWIAAGLPRPHDGMVAVAETTVPGQTDHISLPGTHSGMLFARAVARQVAHFLAEGRLAH